MPRCYLPPDLDDPAAVLTAARVPRTRDALAVASGLVVLARYYLPDYPGQVVDEVDAVAASAYLIARTPLRSIAPRLGCHLSAVSDLRAVVVRAVVSEARRRNLETARGATVAEVAA